jgi:uncharacterized membrane protein YeaQ/YmgE (transglycosylase-associated protein family)
MALTTWMVIGGMLGFVTGQVVPGSAREDLGHFVVTVLPRMAGAFTAWFVVGGSWAKAIGPWSVVVAALGAAGVPHLYGPIARRTV